MIIMAVIITFVLRPTPFTTLLANVYTKAGNHVRETTPVRIFNYSLRVMDLIILL